MSLHVAAKAWIRRALYLGGVLPAWHARRNAGALTVVMFHRVLPRGSAQFATADAGYTVTPSFLDQCVGFFQRHYEIVSISQVLQAWKGSSRLPKYPLLITFDDGWGDNLRFAAPVLSKARVPAIVFAACDAIAQDECTWWQERLFHAVRNSAMTQAQADAIAAAVGAGELAPKADVTDITGWLPIVARLGALNSDRRQPILDELPDLGGCERQMLTCSELAALPSCGVDVGVHGASHSPLTLVADARAELEGARRWVMQVCPGAGATTLSFPHGRYDESVVQAARAAGYELMFSSDPHLNRMIDGRPARDVLGRIYIDERMLADREGRLLPERLAFWLFGRDAA